MRTNLIEINEVSVPFSLSYTLTNAKFLSDFGSTQDIWGEVSNVEMIQYIHKHQLNSSISFQDDKYEINLREIIMENFQLLQMVQLRYPHI